MAFQPRNPFGLDLETAMRVGLPVPQLPPQAPQEAPTAPKMGRGQIIAGILADALAGAAGQPGPFAARMARQQQQQAEEAQWHRRRGADLEDYEAKQRIEQRYKQPDIPPMVRDAQAWMQMGEPERQAYQQMQGLKQGDPDVFVTLPNGQVYAGPKSGLAAALTGGAAPTAPVGKLRPINGGPTQPASGGFPR